MLTLIYLVRSGYWISLKTSGIMTANATRPNTLHKKRKEEERCNSPLKHNEKWSWMVERRVKMISNETEDQF